MVVTFRSVFKAFIFSVIITEYLIIGSLILVCFPENNKRRRILAHHSHYVCRLVTFIFKIRVLVQNKPSEDESGLVVGNHMGFVDIISLLSVKPCVFITSLEMKNTPVLGWITKVGGCGYVNRQNRLHIEYELKDIISILQDNVNVVLYPEAQATNGEQVLPFKKTLLMSAILARRSIFPYVFNYRLVNDKKPVYEDRDKLCWYGDLSFAYSVMGALSFKSMDVEIHFFDKKNYPLNSDRTFVAEDLHRLISSRFNPFLP